MNLVKTLNELQAMLNEYSVANMIGKEFNCAPVKTLCENLKKEDPERFKGFVTDGTDHELMVSVSRFFMEMLNV